MSASKALGGAAAGAGTGAAIAGPYGALVGGIIGGIGGLFKHDPKPYQAPSFSDIDLKKENPELYKELQEMNKMADEAEALYQARRQGPTASELNEMSAARGNLNQNLVSRGLLGSSAGNSAVAGNEQQMSDAYEARKMAELQALYQMKTQARSGYANSLLQAQQAVLAPATATAQAASQQAQANDQSQNQFLSGIANAGMGIYGQNRYYDYMQQHPWSSAQAPAAQPVTYYTGVPAAGQAGNYNNYSIGQIGLGSSAPQQAPIYNPNPYRIGL